MRRREVIAGIASAVAAWPLSAGAQTSSMPTIGLLITPSERDEETQARLEALRRGLAEFGWREGENLRVEYRFGAGDNERIRAYAAELVALAPRLIIVNGTPAPAALHRATRSVPVIFALVVDPVGAGYVASMARPGSNATGFTFIDMSLVGKWVEMLKAVAPATTRAALLHNPAGTPYWSAFLKSAEAATIPVPVLDTPVRDAGEAEAVIAESARKPGASLLIPPDPLNVVLLERYARLAERHRLPALSVYRRFASYGGLMAYGPDTLDIFRRAAAYVDRILKGADPAELPVQAPTKFELAINTRTAKVLGLAVPTTLLALADEVID
ncbi:MAG TPA: ABC transporter substrate-binding protein [Beijerinckiaceae bacterium]|jgi:putative ABC transport system substrate-binding protein